MAVLILLDFDAAVVSRQGRSDEDIEEARRERKLPIEEQTKKP